MSERFPIVDGLIVSIRGVRGESTEADVNKFVHCFQAVWKQIPKTDRKRLHEFWNQDGKATATCPVIAIGANAHMQGMAAACVHGHELLFQPTWLMAATPKHAKNVIAHELGHAMSYACGWADVHPLCDSGECVACECQAYSYMAAWGFDPFEGILPNRKSLMDRLTARKS